MFDRELLVADITNIIWDRRRCGLPFRPQGRHTEAHHGVYRVKEG
ncbi:heptapeptide repeat protein [Geobacter metallireducens GS-15]|uniref:Heptapeptide repeat protein n=1 Tax=Geobacter metallireducens (strain ATCC 53774 / DSM 7210 / GS-15) TaxID=269799 RepID=J9JEN0_GEOMG|nr:heptapeptide repeat protein [Geobacter metallireducens GS-15]